MNYSNKMNSLLNLIFNLTEQVLEDRKKDKNFSSFGNLDYVLKRIDSFLINDLCETDEVVSLLFSIIESVLMKHF